MLWWYTTKLSICVDCWFPRVWIHLQCLFPTLFTNWTVPNSRHSHCNTGAMFPYNSIAPVETLVLLQEVTQAVCGYIKTSFRLQLVIPRAPPKCMQWIEISNVIDMHAVAMFCVTFETRIYWDKNKNLNEILKYMYFNLYCVYNWWNIIVYEFMIPNEIISTCYMYNWLKHIMVYKVIIKIWIQGSQTTRGCTPCGVWQLSQRCGHLLG